MLVTLPYQ